MRTDDSHHIHVQDDSNLPAARSRTAKEWARVLLPFMLAILISIALALLINQFRKQVESLKTYGYLGAFIIGFIGNATVILPAPSLAFTAALGGVLNPVLVGAAAGAGEALGEMTGYLAGVSGKTIVENRARYQMVQEFMERYGGRVFFILAAIPNPLFDIAGITAGIMRFPVWKFLLNAWAGKTLKAILFAGVGRHFFQ